MNNNSIQNIEDYKILDKRYRKEFNKIIEVLVDDIIKNNLVCFAITINILWHEDNIKEFDNDIEEYYDAIRGEIEFYLKVLEAIPMISFLYLAPEENKKKLIHLHIVLGLKSITGFNDNIQSNLLKRLTQEYVFSKDIVIKKLNTKKDTYNWFLYCTKEIGWNIKKKGFRRTLNETEAEKKRDIHRNIGHHIYEFDTILRHSMSVLGEFLELRWVEDMRFLTFGGAFYSKYKDLGSFPQTTNKYTEQIVINIINFYLQYNNFCINNEGIHEPINNTLFSMKLKIKKDKIIENFETIFIELYKTFQVYLEGVDLYIIKTTLYTKVKKLFDDSNLYFLNWVETDLSLLEFNDGVYITQADKFIPKNFLVKHGINTKTTNKISLKYYNKTYHNITKPKIWLKYLSKSLNDDINIFCEYMGSIFTVYNRHHKKQATLYAYGNPGSGKSALIITVLKNLFKNNIGDINKNSNFALISLLDKPLAILNEVEHYKIPTDTLLKLLEGSDLPVDQKHLKAKIQGMIKLVLISNNKLTEKDINIFKALCERIRYFEFIGILLKSDNEYSELIKNLTNEEPNIVIYCIKQYYKNNYKTKQQNKKFIEYFLKDSYKKYIENN